MVADMATEAPARDYEVVVCVKYAVTVPLRLDPDEDPEDIAQQMVKDRAHLLASKGGKVEELDILVHRVTQR